jgi:hypothetical protein
MDVLNKLHDQWELDIIEGGDHSFRTPKSMAPSETDVHRHILDKAIDWLSEDNVFRPDLIVR